jgi:hypothetical protein
VGFFRQKKRVGPLAHFFGPRSYKAQAYRYQAIRLGSTYTWETEAAYGRPGFFLTGASGSTALWRLARLEADTFDRIVLTLAPVRLPHGLAVPNFDQVADPQLREHLTAHFAAFQRGVAANAHLDAVDRAYNITEGVLGYALAQAGRSVPATLHGRIAGARKTIASKEFARGLSVSEYALALADKIRHLHRQSHADQAVERGRTLRPEVGMSVVSDLSELLVEVGLARY